MKIKDYKCKCGHNDFFFADKGSQKGIYCSYCGKWVKWADKDERNLAMNCGSNIGDYDIPIHNAIIIPEGATNGDMIKALFPDAMKSNFIESGLDMKDYVTIYVGDYEMRVAYDWWSAPYKSEIEDKE